MPHFDEGPLLADVTRALRLTAPTIVQDDVYILWRCLWDTVLMQLQRGPHATATGTGTGTAESHRDGSPARASTSNGLHQQQRSGPAGVARRPWHSRDPVRGIRIRLGAGGLWLYVLAQDTTTASLAGGSGAGGGTQRSALPAVGFGATDEFLRRHHLKMRQQGRAVPASVQSVDLAASRMFFEAAGALTSVQSALAKDKGFRHDLCHAFLQAVVDAIGAAGASGDDVIVTFPSLGTLTIRGRILNFDLDPTLEGRCAGAGTRGARADDVSPSSTRHAQSDEDAAALHSALSSSPTSDAAKAAVPSRPATRSSTQMVLPALARHVLPFTLDGEFPLGEDDLSVVASSSAFAAHSRQTQQRAASVQQASSAARSRLASASAGNTALEEVRRLGISSKFSPAPVFTATRGTASSRRTKSRGPPPSRGAAACEQLDRQLDGLHQALQRSLDRVRPSLIHPKAIRQAAFCGGPFDPSPTVASEQACMDDTAAAVSPPKNFNLEVNAHARRHVLDGEEIAALSSRRAERIDYGHCLLEQGADRSAKIDQRRREDKAVQQRRNEISVLTEALRIIDQGSSARAAAEATNQSNRGGAAAKASA